MTELLPAILAKDETTFRERFAAVQDVAPVIHVDVMDGAFVPNRTWFDASVLSSLDSPARFELHLMVNDPAKYLDTVRSIESVIRAIWHIEASVHHENLIARCREYQKETGLAINPKTPLDRLAPHAESIDEILIMGGEPGFSGTQLDPHTIERAREAHARWPHVVLGFDIGVNADTIPSLKAAGISRFCAASAIFNARVPKDEIRRLQLMV